MKAEYMSGRVARVIFNNNSFYIMRMVLDPGDSGLVGEELNVTIKGDVSGLTVKDGTWFGFEGKWVNDAKYGKQLKILRAPVLEDGWTVETAVNMLTANGVGTGIMNQIQEHFGDDDLIDALGDAEKLKTVPGLAKFSALHVAARWESVQAHFKTLDFLTDLGVPSGMVKTIWSHFGDETEGVLSKDPWRLVEVDGITFAIANAAASRLGLKNIPAQTRGAVLSAVKNGRGFGHLYTQTGSIAHSVNLYLSDVDQKDIITALVGLHKDKLVVIDRKTKKGVTAVYEPWCYQMEKDAATLLISRNESAALLPGEARTVAYIAGLGSVGPATAAEGKKGRKKGRMERVVLSSIKEWGAQSHLQLSPDQATGIYNALTAPVSVLTGLPGTGKTTSLQAAVRILQDAGVTFLLCAPTGIAAKNLSARTGAPASTIHRAFAAKGISENRRKRTYEGVVGESKGIIGGPSGEWGYSQDNPFPAEVIFVDEASMLDQHLIYRLLDCTRPDARLVFVGDYAQLPSVGPGNVLRDLINAEVFPTIKLEQIFRQADTSGIVYAAHSMHRGEVPTTDKDFHLLYRKEEQDVLAAILKIAVKLHAQRHDRTFQILSPKHQGPVGVTNLNQRLRELLNPASPGLAEAKIGKWALREGDRVMVIKNDYKLGVFNGDVGTISKVSRARKELEIKVFNHPPLLVTIPFKRVPSLLSLAYATTVHKAQGLEYDVVVMPLVTSFYHQLQRNLLYTAITRAREKVFLVGHPEALASAVHNSKEDFRMTLFLDRLTNEIEGLAP